jgi:hypothetical protein
MTVLRSRPLLRPSSKEAIRVPFLTIANVAGLQPLMQMPPGVVVPAVSGRCRDREVWEGR